VNLIDLDIDQRLVDALNKDNIIEPTVIQTMAIGAVFSKKSLIIESATGTGKTFAYLLPIMSQIDTVTDNLQVLILAPTHELVMQIYELIKCTANEANMPIRSAGFIGKVHINRQVEKLKVKPHVIVGTPGRILDLFKIKKLKLHNVSTVVIDEASSLMLSESRHAVKTISASLMRDTQRIFVSALFSDQAKKRVLEICPKVEHIRAAEKTNSDIQHCYIEITDSREKFKTLRKFLAAFDKGKTLIFVKKNPDVAIFANKLEFHKVAVLQLSGEMSKIDRQKNLAQFENKKDGVLIATAVAARGLDIDSVDRVVHYDIPIESSDYLHRSGRTGRAGRKGISVAIADSREARRLLRITEEAEISTKRMKMSNGKFCEYIIENNKLEQK